VHFVVEDFDEVVEACLLLQEVASGRLGGFFFEGEMHAFMAAVLLGMSGLDAFHADPQAEPPDGELLRLNKAWAEAKGTPLSLRMLAGRPRSLKSLSNTGKA
jgi:hypothetical protein